MKIHEAGFLVGAFVKRGDYNSGFLKTDEVTGFTSFISCNVYRI